VDDVLLFDDDKDQLWDWKRAIIKRTARLRLTIHEARAQVRPVTEGFPFLGFVVYPHKRRLKRRKGIAYARKLQALVDDYADGRIPLERVTASVQGWANHARYGDTLGLRRALLESVVVPAPQVARTGCEE
jgi:hypothetical protein